MPFFRAIMIVCLCHRVSDRDIRRQVAEGVSNFEVLQDETRLASACGSCLDCAREVFDEALARPACTERCAGRSAEHSGGLPISLPAGSQMMRRMTVRPELLTG